MKDDEIRFLEEDISKRKKTISEQQTQLDDSTTFSLN